MGADAGPGRRGWISGILKAESTGLADVEVMMGVGSGIQGEAWVSLHMMEFKGKSLDGVIGNV